MTKYLFYIMILFTIVACNLNANNTENTITTNYFKPRISTTDSAEVLAFYRSKHSDDKTSTSEGTVSNGSLKNGKIAPYYGDNFTYFDKDSYLGARAFSNHKTIEIVLNAYDSLKNIMPHRHFFLMELSNENGGKIFPHKTHQNGLSVDFMMPKLKDNQPYYGLDTIGKDHYWLAFDNNGAYEEDKSVKIDFELIAQHILILEAEAKKEGYGINKVIIKIEFKDELLAGTYGSQLKNSGIYIVKSLTPLVNNLHDEHYHIDFEKI